MGLRAKASVHRGYRHRRAFLILGRAVYVLQYSPYQSCLFFSFTTAKYLRLSIFKKNNMQPTICRLKSKFVRPRLFDQGRTLSGPLLGHFDRMPGGDGISW